MTLTADSLPDTAPLARDLLLQVREQRRSADRAELAVLELALEFAHASQALLGQEPWQPDEAPSWLEDQTDLLDEEDRSWIGIPALRWDAPAAFAAANDMSTTQGKALLRDVLVLDHRTPAFWAAVRAGRVPAWRARRVAQALLGQPADVCRYVDLALSERLVDGTAIGPVVLDRLVDEAMLRLHAEQREVEQLEALDARHVTIDPASINHTGIGQLDARADWSDLAPFDETLSPWPRRWRTSPSTSTNRSTYAAPSRSGSSPTRPAPRRCWQGDLDAEPTKAVSRRDGAADRGQPARDGPGRDRRRPACPPRPGDPRLVRTSRHAPRGQADPHPGPGDLCDESVEHDERALSTHDPTRTDASASSPATAPVCTPTARDRLDSATATTSSRSTRAV